MQFFRNFLISLFPRLQFLQGKVFQRRRHDIRVFKMSCFHVQSLHVRGVPVNGTRKLNPTHTPQTKNIFSISPIFMRIDQYLIFFTQNNERKIPYIDYLYVPIVFIHKKPGRAIILSNFKQKQFYMHELYSGRFKVIYKKLNVLLKKM